MKKPVQYIRCPRCELNWIQKREKFCSVCKAEMKANGNLDNFDEEVDLEICPVCKVNYINEGEDMCHACAKLREAELADDDEAKSDDWKTYIYEKDDAPEEEFEGDLTVGNMDDELEDDDLNFDIEIDDIDEDEDDDDYFDDTDEDDELDFDDIDYDDDDDDDFDEDDDDDE